MITVRGHDAARSSPEWLVGMQDFRFSSGPSASGVGGEWGGAWPYPGAYWLAPSGSPPLWPETRPLEGVPAPSAGDSAPGKFLFPGVRFCSRLFFCIDPF